MQRCLSAGVVRVVSASTIAPPAAAEYVVEDVEDEQLSVCEESEYGEEIVDDELEEGLEEAGSDDSQPVTMRVARYLESGKPGGSRKRKRAKLNHLSSDQKVERRKVLNRIAAQMARDRKKVQMDELESFVKELASENVRLARENAELRQRSTDLEVENVKLRTNVSRPSATAVQQLSSAATQPVTTSAVAKPVGIAARVSDVTSNVRSTPEATENESVKQSDAKRARLINAECVRTTPNGVRDAPQRNAAAVCASTQQQYSFARRARALFSVLFALLLVGMRNSSCPLGASGLVPAFRAAASSRRSAPASGSKRTHADSASRDTGQATTPSANPSANAKLERLGALVARRIARSPPLREAYWKLRHSGALTARTVAWMKQRVAMSARLVALRRASALLHMRAEATSASNSTSMGSNNWSLMEDSRGL